MIRILQGDCLAILPTLDADSIDSCLTDPPYHLTNIVKRFGAANAAPAQHGTDGAYARAARGFMGKQWDGGDVAFRPETWAEVLRVLKPGAYLVAFASTRGYHRMVCAIEDSGFVIHPMLAWVFATGFPKAHKIDAPGAEGFRYGLQSLKPAMEPICLAQKPMIGTGTENWLRWGTGALNVDGCRCKRRRPRLAHIVGLGPQERFKSTKKVMEGGRDNGGFADTHNPAGRWPANVAHDGSAEVLAAFPNSDHARGNTTPTKRQKSNGVWAENGSPFGVGPNGPIDCGDTGTAARFFYSAKADEGDRLGSKHPTVKPVDLMRWLVRLVTPPGGCILDPFAGSGTSGMAAMAEGFDATLIEMEAEYVADIRRRIAHVSGADSPLFAGVAP